MLSVIPEGEEILQVDMFRDKRRGVVGTREDFPRQLMFSWTSLLHDGMGGLYEHHHPVDLV